MTDIELLRHTLATLAYRAAKTIRGASESFASYRAGPSTKTPLEIVSHMGDLFDWALSMAQGEARWNSQQQDSWRHACERFFNVLKKFDDYLASGQPVNYELTRLFQAPVADALTHTGQLAMLRRLSGSPIKGESYNRANIAIGKISMDQTPADPRYEFD